MVEAATEKPVRVVAALLLGGAALGYLLLPLIMVVVGRVIHREHLPRLRVAAVAAAAIGVRASELLPFGLFGLLTYVEPVLLAVVSITILGESLTPVDLLTYGPIAVALCLLGIENATARRFPVAPPGLRAIHVVAASARDTDGDTGSHSDWVWVSYNAACTHVCSCL